MHSMGKIEWAKFQCWISPDGGTDLTPALEMWLATLEQRYEESQSDKTFVAHHEQERLGTTPERLFVRLIPVNPQIKRNYPGEAEYIVNLQEWLKSPLYRVPLPSGDRNLVKLKLPEGEPMDLYTTANTYCLFPVFGFTSHMVAK